MGYDPYLAFRQSDLTESELQKWRTGRNCSYGQTGRRNSSTSGVIYCPMPFEAANFTECCGDSNHQRCCTVTSTQNPQVLRSNVKWGIGIGALFGCLIMGTLAICLFNKCSYICSKSKPTSAPRPKLKLNASKQNVRPMHKRTLLKTGNYTVEQSWDQMVVKFHNTEFYDKFWEAMKTRYKVLTWKQQQKELHAVVQCSTGASVGLRMLTESRVLIVTRSGNNSWVMNDFQNICKNLSVSEFSDKMNSTPKALRRSLTPRLPTIGEEFYDAGEYRVKISHSEVEVKFTEEATFAKFKRVLLFKHPTLLWSKYLQRDCSQIPMPNGKTVTVHLWEDINSIWISGDGKRDWYNTAFQELYADAISDKYIDYTTDRKSAFLVRSNKSPCQLRDSIRDTKVDYSVKTLDTGGYEIEFPTSDILPMLRRLLEEKHTDLKWQEYTCRHVTKLALAKNKSVSIHFASPSTRLRKIWVYDEPGCREWFNYQFIQLYAEALERLCIVTDDSLPSDNEISITPIESVV